MKHTLLVFFLAMCIHPVFSQEAVDKILERGYGKYMDGNCEGAIEDYNLALKKEKNNSEAYYLRGVCKSLMEKNKEAIEDFNLAIQHNPQYAEAYFEKAFSLYALDENETALTFYNKAIEIDPEYAEAYMNRGSVKHNLNNLKGACEDWAMAESMGLNLAYDLLKEFCME
jgi:tetratricopeptide (TPR) repeat protein